jgi:multidrug efflux system outer membrane protein
MPRRRPSRARAEEGTGVRLRLTVVTATAAAVLALVAGCAVGPDYKAPDTPLPVSWKLEEPWRVSTPSDSADKGPWWKRFGDATLDTLQAQAMAGSPTLAIANARLAQARAALTPPTRPACTRSWAWARAPRA